MAAQTVQRRVYVHCADPQRPAADSALCSIVLSSREAAHEVFAQPKMKLLATLLQLVVDTMTRMFSFSQVWQTAICLCSQQTQLVP